MQSKIRLRFYSPMTYIEQSQSTEHHHVTLSQESIRYPLYVIEANGGSKSRKRKRAAVEYIDNIDEETAFIGALIQEFHQFISEMCKVSYSCNPESDRFDPIRGVQKNIASLEDAIKPMLAFANRAHCKDEVPDVTPWEEVMASVYLCKHRIIFSATGHLWNPCGYSYYIPPRSAFVWDDIRRGLQRLGGHNSPLRGHYQVIVCDPPWGNKSARRGSRYQTNFSNNDLMTLSRYIDTLSAPTGCMLAIWVTNSKEVISFVKEQLLQSWGFVYVSTWWWVKITHTGAPVCPVRAGAAHRKPYERVIIGYRGPGAPEVSTQRMIARADGEGGSSPPTAAGRAALDCSVGISSDNVCDDLSGGSRGCCMCPCGFFCGLCAHEKYVPTSGRGEEGEGGKCVPHNDREYFPHDCHVASRDASITRDNSTMQPNGLSGVEEGQRDALEPPSPVVVGGCVGVVATEVIVSAPVRHSWKPPLRALLQAARSRLLAAHGNGQCGDAGGHKGGKRAVTSTVDSTVDSVEGGNEGKVAGGESNGLDGDWRGYFGVELELFAR